MIITQPTDLKDCKIYEVYRKELAIWETNTDIEEEGGAILAVRLPNESKLKKKSFRECGYN